MNCFIYIQKEIIANSSIYSFPVKEETFKALLDLLFLLMTEFKDYFEKKIHAHTHTIE